MAPLKTSILGTVSESTEAGCPAVGAAREKLPFVMKAPLASRSVSVALRFKEPALPVEPTLAADRKAGSRLHDRAVLDGDAGARAPQKPKRLRRRTGQRAALAQVRIEPAIGKLDRVCRADMKRPGHVDAGPSAKGDAGRVDEEKAGAPLAAVSRTVALICHAPPPVTRLMTLAMPGLVVLKFAASPLARLKA